ncbi:adenosylcobinamide-GDP ribazoletransferase [Rhizobium bangladeshense]|uniref:Adenosylcobinamide-GDP ribazoletransferase n=1 Tax=Rhizobium bangladeshense TaxID=1138189 RepID=A0ABS7LD78_9HYPH|nr:adenosylcobinamide-GDP ribazoletransferase [Rhizobium bangladeshense]MBX4870781.1 adenosylcobinamide-GDP ribazoletransferase [Rhizobium bangladeshense]MBX4876264.1 adenosylcobinamide-GDP ribazoletransferase [Rhizobium bangladeshense]MBX4887229.1 adenosylcobinamide-GDP ribazoletransferase [Rhizobium bangladeshense]MBX4888992.1 adenosylcobinamide-GDP ribazoletransferase [Rhizobium bangladeshense]MBX4900860.1 adenosylcobinamide-GDP ribazoletransferase [Rhizobium bangladeshense]
MKIKDYAVDTARAVAFLSRLPMPPALFKGYDGRLGRLVRAFPLAGLVIGFIPALALLLLSGIRADPLVAALIALSVQALATGALHEDGLADTADGIGGGKNREQSLIIMKDSRIGTYGAIALILSFAVRAAALAAIVRNSSPLAAALAVPAVAALSRGAIAWHWQRLPPAKVDGVAASTGQPNEAAMHFALVSAGLLAALLIWPAFGLQPLVASLLASGAAGFAFTAVIRRKLAGHTGDTLGAMQQICEIATLCALATAL